jgi:hypothetical protein
MRLCAKYDCLANYFTVHFVHFHHFLIAASFYQ